MVFALTPVQSAFATHGADEGARDINEAGDVCDGRDDNEFDDIANEETDNAAECLADLGIAYGFADGSYRPTEPITREQMASFLARKLQAADQYDAPENPAPADYTDREQIADSHLNNVDIVTEVGIAQGKDDGSYAPGEPVTRAQMAAFIVRQIEEITGEELTAQDDHFTDDDGNWSEENINILADLGIVEGDTNGDYNPSDLVTRGQMALFIARDIDALNDVYGITFTSIREEPAAPTNQTFTVITGGEDVVQEEGSQRDFAFDVGDADFVDVALIECEDVTTDADGNVSFADAENNGAGNDEADLGVTFARITSVNGVVIPGGTAQVDQQQPNNDGTVSVTVEGDANEQGCYVVVVFNDADDDDQLDLDANNQPTENFGISGETTLATVRGLDADPENAVNRFGEAHTVTATLQDRADENDTNAGTVAADGAVIRFQVFRGGTVVDRTDGGDATFNTNNEQCTGGTVVATGSDTTEDGVAEFTYTGPADPRANADDPDVEDCILAFNDRDNDGVLDANEESDAVEKTFSDNPNVAQLDAEPEFDTNPTGTVHTVTATVTNQFGEPIAGERVRFEVFRENDDATTTTQTEFDRVQGATAVRTTNDQGVATFSYTGPQESANDVIVVCADDPDTTTTDETQDCGQATAAGTQFVLAEDPDGNNQSDQVRKAWVEAAATNAETAIAPDSCVLANDEENNTLDVENDGTNQRFTYDTNDQFTVDGQPVDIAAFEQAADEGDRIAGTFRPGGVSNFNLRNDTNCTADPGETRTDGTVVPTA